MSHCKTAAACTNHANNALPLLHSTVVTLRIVLAGIIQCSSFVSFSVDLCESHLHATYLTAAAPFADANVVASSAVFSATTPSIAAAAAAAPFAAATADAPSAASITRT